MITEVHGHSVNLDLIPKRGFILDLGCRGFEFTNHFKSLGCIVYSVDLGEFEGNYYRLGISYKNGYCSVEFHPDPQAERIRPGDQLVMITIQQFSEMMEISHWDLIKMDIEGEELPILARAKHPLATQVSVEFHAHRGQTKEQIDSLLTYLGLWYNVFNDKWEERHQAGFNYWDILLVAK